MRIRYTWRREEWQDAVRLATVTPRQRPRQPFLLYVLAAVAAAGVLGEVVERAREISFSALRGSLLPVLLVVALVAVLLLFASRRVTGTLSPLPMPQGEQELVLQEDGWAWGNVPPATSGAEELRSWEQLQEQRCGKQALVLIGPPGRFAAVPLRALNEERAGHLHRLLTRKLKQNRS